MASRHAYMTPTRVPPSVYTHRQSKREFLIHQIPRFKSRKTDHVLHFASSSKRFSRSMDFLTSFLCPTVPTAPLCSPPQAIVFDSLHLTDLLCRILRLPFSQVRGKEGNVNLQSRVALSLPLPLIYQVLQPSPALKKEVFFPIEKAFLR